MKSGSGIEPKDRIQEPVHGHRQRQDSYAATPPSDGAPSAVPADGGADASSPSPLPAAPVDRPQERFHEQAGGGSRGTHGSSSAAAWGGPDDIPFLAPPAPRSAGSSPSTPSPDGASAFAAGASTSATDRGKRVKWRHPVVVPKEARRPFDSKLVFEQLVREQAAINEAHIQWAEREEEEEKKKKPVEQVKSSHAKKALWSKFKNYFTRKRKIVDREGRRIYSEHVGHQTIPITEVGNYYRVTKDMAIRVNLDAYLRFRPVHGDGECFYRSFMFSYLEQVLDRQDTYEEHRLLDAVKRVSTQHTNLGWTSEFCRSYKEMHNCLTVVACHQSFTYCWHKLEFEVYCKVNNPIPMNLKRNLLAKEQ
ncbi:uncharacterized protein LOC124690434 [Lolium rigidum]|uniref:uncharacterized protein LOC124690434 n=1 Tax=Lolium rigidum TaxID=89674 RepID=UPI001F5D3BFE|nr:uncharacterized protein LOC124690434 [Lolium rigidum]